MGPSGGELITAITTPSYLYNYSPGSTVGPSGGELNTAVTTPIQIIGSSSTSKKEVILSGHVRPVIIPPPPQLPYEVLVKI